MTDIFDKKVVMLFQEDLPEIPKSDHRDIGDGI